MQYTIRNIPDYVDTALREAARQQGVSLNQMAILALERGAGLDGSSRQRDLADVAGSWQEDLAFDSAIAALDMIEESMWR